MAQLCDAVPSTLTAFFCLPDVRLFLPSYSLYLKPFCLVSASRQRSPGARGSGAAPASLDAALGPDRGLAPEVLDFERFVASHGETGGWEAEDNREFEKVVKACRGDYLAAIEVVCERMIGYTRSDVVAHARWHMDYCDLLLRKRTALARWRVERDAERARIHAGEALLGPAAGGEPGADAAGSGAFAADCGTRDPREEASRQARKQAVQQWKAARAEQERAAAEAAARAQAEAAERERQEREARQRALKAQLEAKKAAEVMRLR